MVRIGVLDSNLCHRLWRSQRGPGGSHTQWVCSGDRSGTELHDVISDKGSTYSVSDTRRLACWSDSWLFLNSNSDRSTHKHARADGRKRKSLARLLLKFLTGPIAILVIKSQAWSPVEVAIGPERTSQVVRRMSASGGIGTTANTWIVLERRLRMFTDSQIRGQPKRGHGHWETTKTIPM
jgi:hypothetical protein